MTYTIEFGPKAKKFMKNLPVNISLQIINKLKQIKQDPFRFLKHFEGEYYKLRIGTFRALVDVDVKEKVIFIEVFDKRGRIYKR